MRSRPPHLRYNPRHHKKEYYKNMPREYRDILVDSFTVLTPEIVSKNLPDPRGPPTGRSYLMPYDSDGV